MIYALKRAAEELRTQVEKYQIIIEPEKNVIHWRDEAIHLKDYTPRSTCLKHIRAFIRKAKHLEHERNMKKQGTLL